MNTLTKSTDKLHLEEVKCVQDTCPTQHYFSDGIYTREIFMPKGLIIVGKAHKTRHLNVVLTGECDVMINGEMKHIKAPFTFESLAWSQKTLYIQEDCRWMTIHVNDDDETDLDILEERYIDSEDDRPHLIRNRLMNERKNECLGQ